MEPLTQVPYENLPGELVRLRTPLVSNSLIHAILLACDPAYRTGYFDGKAFDPFQLVDDIERALAKKGPLVTELASVTGYTIDIIDEHFQLVERGDGSDTIIRVLKLRDGHYETLGRWVDHSIVTEFHKRRERD